MIIKFDLILPNALLMRRPFQCCFDEANISITSYQFKRSAIWVLLKYRSNSVTPLIVSGTNQHEFVPGK